MNFDINNLKELSPPVLTMLALNAVGFALKMSNLPNRFIPIILIVLGGVGFPFVYDYGDLIINVRSQTAVAVFMGLIIGGAAVGAHQALAMFKKEKE